MPNQHYHYFTCFILLCLFPALLKAQTVYEGQVINAVTDEALVKASVTLSKAKTGTATNQQGYFRLIVDETIANDSLVVSFVGFKSYNLAVADYQPNIFIRLQPATNQLSQVNIGAAEHQALILQNFNYADVRDLRGPASYYYTQPYYAPLVFAKQFETFAAGNVLTTVTLGRRLAYDIPTRKDDLPHVSTNKLTRFLLHVITPDTITGEPGKKLFTKEITLNDNSLRITFDLSNEKIILPNRKFFVAIEWIHAPVNEVVRLDIGEKVDKVKKDGSQKKLDVSEYYIMYQPFLVLIPRANRAATWSSYDGKTWIQLSQRSEVALSATVTY
ncbi:carboxypeptidase-like regulatory domain-containing protein [Mucilaginibacter antarcticus]|uniref:Carboxypeptidase-like regulatory domain-containing protein n=1 Tax=Mucilaginibacter antarcticus TaxID=1855725 RepID=A0ABW5XPV1_9SPHI